jgi:hypothetical protein
MGRDDDPWSDGARQRDVVEFGGPEGPGWWTRRWRRWVPAVVVIAVAVAIAVHATHGKRPSASATPAPSTVAASSQPAEVDSAGPTSTVPAVTNVGHPILGINDGWELFGRGPDGIVRIEFAAGRVTRTAVPRLLSTGPTWFIVGDHGAIVRPLDFVPGYLVPDGQPAQRLSGLLDDGGIALPGPDGHSVWFTPEAQPIAMTLVGVDGRGAGASITLPKGTDGFVEPDGTGYVVFGSSGGVYLARPDGSRRITTGSLIASGPSTWLTQDCDDLRRCPTVVTNRTTGRRHVLAGTILPGDSSFAGPTSPDGAFAATRTTGSVELDPTQNVHLIDLESGVDHRFDVPLGPVDDFAMMVWSPDSRWLFVVGGGGRLYAIDSSTGRVSDLGIPLPPVDQLAVRNAAR